jgi:hypothetical protein
VAESYIQQSKSLGELGFRIRFCARDRCEAFADTGAYRHSEPANLRAATRQAEQTDARYEPFGDVSFALRDQIRFVDDR